MASILGVDGLIREVSPKNGSDFSLEELKAIVEGYIEIVNLGNGFILVINEEGKLKGMPVNYLATDVFVRYTVGFDIIVGPALLCKEEEVK